MKFIVVKHAYEVKYEVIMNIEAPQRQGLPLVLVVVVVELVQL